MGEQLVLRMTEVAERLSIGRSTVYELVARGELEVVHIGRSARAPAEALDGVVRKLRGQTVTNAGRQSAGE
jgi:excisionase family DNA binding protein